MSGDTATSLNGSSGQGTREPGYGVCDTSIIPVRSEPAHSAEMSTQILFGEHFTILRQDEAGEWLYVELEFDKYKGWIDAKKYRPISRKFFDILNSMEWPVSKELISLVHGKEKVFPILYGSVLPVYNQGVIALETEAYKIQGEVFYVKKNTNFQFLQVVSRFYLAAPYLWGGRTTFGIDCSGLVQQVYKICGYKLPRDSSQQVKEGQEVAFEGAKPGDIAFFNNKAGKLDHVGIVYDNGQVMHASGEVRLDMLDKNGIYNQDLGEHTHYLHSVRRIW